MKLDGIAITAVRYFLISMMAKTALTTPVDPEHVECVKYCEEYVVKRVSLMIPSLE